MRISVYSKATNQDNAKKVEEFLLSKGMTLDNNNPEVVISIGGDGTFLRAIHHFSQIDENILYVGINYGTLGFYSQYQKDELEIFFEDLINKNYQINEYRLLKGLASFENEKIDIYALNEIRLENPFHTLISDVYINNELLEKFRGNGLIVTTSIGSSAYNKSLGGALVDPTLAILELTEIAPIENNIYHSLGSSLILKEDAEIVLKGDFMQSVVGYDHLNIDKTNLKELKISLSKKKIRVLYKKDDSLTKLYKRSFVK